MKRAGLACGLGVMAWLAASCRLQYGDDSGGEASAIAELKREIGTDLGLAPRLSIASAPESCRHKDSPSFAPHRLDCAPTGIPRPSPAVMRIAARAAEDLRERLSPEALQESALIDLVWSGGERKPLRRSISYLHTAARLSPRPATILSDLSAAYLIAAEGSRDPRDLLEAVEAADRALEIENTHEMAQFNAAIALERLGLRDQARSAWRAYLATDSTSHWSVRARSAVTTLSGTEAGFRNPDAAAARVLGFEQLLGDWGQALTQGNRSAADSLWERSSAIAAQALTLGDRSLVDDLEYLKVQRRSSATWRAAARARAHYAAAMKEYRAGHYAAAESRLHALVAAGSMSNVLRGWAQSFLGAALVYVGQWEAGRQLLTRVARETDAARYPALAGRAHWALGTTSVRRGRIVQAVAEYEAAEPLLARAGEPESIGAVQCLRMEAHFLLGEFPGAYEAMHRALATLHGYRRSVWLHNTLYVAAPHVVRDGYPRAALRLYDEDVAIAGATGRPIDVAEARLARAQLLATMERLPEARADVDAARPIVIALRDGDQRGLYVANLRLAENDLRLRTHDRAKIAELDSVVSYFSDIRNPTRLLGALVARANALVANGALGAATEDLDHAVALIGGERNALNATTSRASLLRSTRGLFERVVLLHAAAGRSDSALARLESARANLPVFGPSRVVAGAPPHGLADEVGVELLLAGDTLLSWMIGPTGPAFARNLIDNRRFTKALEVARTAPSLRMGDRELRESLATLYDMIIRPLAPRLGASGGGVALAIDGLLNDVPFAALIDTATGRFLIEDHALRYVTTLAARAAAKRSSRREMAALLVAVSAQPREERVDLDSLPAAEEEINTARKIYPGAAVLVGDTAVRLSFMRALSRATVLHFAGHAVFDEEHPERSRLLFAASAPDDSAVAVYADELARMDLRHLDLVVLSACESARASSGSQATGLSGLAEAFLSAGAGGVVGSQWRVDDASSAMLMTAFHRAYKRDSDPAAALRAAQIGMLRAGASPGASIWWAGFRYVGNR